MERLTVTNLSIMFIWTNFPRRNDGRRMTENTVPVSLIDSTPTFRWTSAQKDRATAIETPSRQYLVATASRSPRTRSAQRSRTNATKYERVKARHLNGYVRLPLPRASIDIYYGGGSSSIKSPTSFLAPAVAISNLKSAQR